LREDQNPVRINSAGAVLFLQTGVEPPEIPTVTPLPTSTPVPTATSTQTPVPFTPTPTGTAAPTPVPLPVTVTDSLETQTDISGSSDQDAADQRELVIRWNLDVSNIKDFHVYVQINDGPPQFLGRTGNGTDTFFQWKTGIQFLSTAFNDGPQFNTNYQFRVFALANDDSNTVFGPFLNGGNIEFLESQ